MALSEFVYSAHGIVLTTCYASSIDELYPRFVEDVQNAIQCHVDKMLEYLLHRASLNPPSPGHRTASWTNALKSFSTFVMDKVNRAVISDSLLRTTSSKSYATRGGTTGSNLFFLRLVLAPGLNKTSICTPPSSTPLTPCLPVSVI